MPTPSLKDRIDALATRCGQSDKTLAAAAVNALATANAAATAATDAVQKTDMDTVIADLAAAVQALRKTLSFLTDYYNINLT